MDGRSPGTTRTHPTDDSGVAGQVRSAAAEVAGTGGERARDVAEEAAAQARNITEEARDRLGQEFEEQTGRVADVVGRWARDLDRMAEASDEGSQLKPVVAQLSARAREFADELKEGGGGEAVQRVRAFARRRPTAFLLGSAAAGFVVGRLARGMAEGDGSGGPGGATRRGPAPSAAPEPVPVVPVAPNAAGGVIGEGRATP